MKLIRILTIFMVVLSTSLSGAISGAMAADHVVSMNMSVQTTDAMPGDHGGCCDHDTERSATCHVVPAVIPVMTFDRSDPDVLRMVSFGPTTILIGTEPVTLLDPPRAV